MYDKKTKCSVCGLAVWAIGAYIDEDFREFCGNCWESRPHEAEVGVPDLPEGE